MELVYHEKYPRAAYSEQIPNEDLCRMIIDTPLTETIVN